MRLSVINPNSTEAMTRAIGEAASAASGPGTRVRAVTPWESPPAIQGAEDGEAALPGLFRVFDEEVAAGAEAAVIACFDDTGLWELRARARIPVIGIGEAAYTAAMLAGARFSVVTTLAVSVPVLEENIARYGFAGRCARVRASGVPVLELEADPEGSAERVAAEIGRAAAEDGIDAVVLGCAGMADLAARMAARFGLPVIEGVSAAVRLAETLHDLPGMRLGARAG